MTLVKSTKKKDPGVPGSLIRKVRLSNGGRHPIRAPGPASLADSELVSPGAWSADGLPIVCGRTPLGAVAVDIHLAARGSRPGQTDNLFTVPQNGDGFEGDAAYPGQWRWWSDRTA